MGNRNLRNDWLFNKRSIRHPKDLASWAISYVDLHRKANLKLVVTAQDGDPLPIRDRWVPPPVACFKINTDVAMDYVSLSVGLGVIIRDNTG